MSTEKVVKQIVGIELETLIAQINILIAITDDVLPCPKDIATEDIGSIVPVLFAGAPASQEAVDTAMRSSLIHEKL